MDLRNYFSDVLEDKAIEPCIQLVKKKAEEDGQTIEETAKQINWVAFFYILLFCNIGLLLDWSLVEFIGINVILFMISIYVYIDNKYWKTNKKK